MKLSMCTCLQKNTILNDPNFIQLHLELYITVIKKFIIVEMVPAYNNYCLHV